MITHDLEFWRDDVAGDAIDVRDSMASASMIAGRMVVRLCASLDFPAPGGPRMVESDGPQWLSPAFLADEACAVAW
jgi:hypothetical protein